LVASAAAWQPSRLTAYALYTDPPLDTDPPLGRVGMTEAEVRKTGKPALIAMEDVSRDI
jgi:pyruvate/2-oxoglutarate dehydrogenase complex dihydrolipoamide dehydrogenase (E3) component